MKNFKYKSNVFSYPKELLIKKNSYTRSALSPWSWNNTTRTSVRIWTFFKFTYCLSSKNEYVTKISQLKSLTLK